MQTMPRKTPRVSPNLALLICLTLAIIAMVGALQIGTIPISLHQLIDALVSLVLTPTEVTQAHTVLWDIRAPRNSV